MNGMMAGTPWIRVCWGELLDKIAILALKVERIGDPVRRRNAGRELALLREAQARAAPALPEAVAALRRELAAVNARLWEVEDAIRALDRAGDFGPRFVELARAVHTTNDLRAALKRRVNELMGSDLVEEKWYPTSSDPA